MTEYEQFQQFFQQHGVSYAQRTHESPRLSSVQEFLRQYGNPEKYSWHAVAGPSLEAGSALIVSQTHFCFDTNGQFLGLTSCLDGFEDSKPREDNA